MTLPQTSVAFNNEVLFSVHTVCQPRACSDSTPCHSEDEAKGAAPAHDAAGHVAAGEEQWRNHVRVWELPRRGDTDISAYNSGGKAGHVAKPGGHR